MTATGTAMPKVLHALPGRVRLHWPAWRECAPELLETHLEDEIGVESVHANPLTANVLIEFDPTRTDIERLVRCAAAAPAQRASTSPSASGASDRTHPIPVRGLRDNPDLGARLVAHLRRYPRVRVRASVQTGRLRIEGPATAAVLDAVLTTVRALETPRAPSETGAVAPFVEDETTYPPNPRSLLQSGLRLVGAASGLLAIGIEACQSRPLPAAPMAARAAGMITLLQGLPMIRNGVYALLGRDAADLVLTLPKIAMMTLGASPLGLAVAALEALHLYAALRGEGTAWGHYEAAVETAEVQARGTALCIEAGERIPFAASIVEGTGTALGVDGLPVPAGPGTELPGGLLLQGGPFRVTPHPPEPCPPESALAGPRPVPVSPSWPERYLRGIVPVSLAYIGITALLTRSPSRTLDALLLVNARAAMLGTAAAAADAAARVVQAGATVVGSQPARPIRLPQVLLLDHPALLTRGLEIASSLSLEPEVSATDVVNLAAKVSAAAGSPWGTSVFRASDAAPASAGSFDGWQATATIRGVAYALGAPTEGEALPPAVHARRRGQHVLLLREVQAARLLGAVLLRPGLAPGVDALVRACATHRVQIAVRRQGDALASERLAQRAGIPLVAGETTALIREHQRAGARVMYISARSTEGAAFLAADLAVGLTDAAVPFSEAPDLLVPGLDVLAEVLETAALHEAVRREVTVLSVGSNALGGGWGLWGRAHPAKTVAASSVADTASLAVLVWVGLRLRRRQQQGERRGASKLVDPQPEQWGARPVDALFQALQTRPEGLTEDEAVRRRRVEQAPDRRHPLFEALEDNLRSPLTAVVAAATGLTLLHGARTDAAILALTLAANLGIGVWQEYRSNTIAQALRRREVTTARVLRDGATCRIPTHELVPGDLLLIAHGERSPADARLIEAHDLEVDEAALTGESFPVPKRAQGGTASNRILLEGSDVLMGHGRAVVVAVGRGTRMGATTAAVLSRIERENVLAVSLARLFWRVLPATVLSGATVTLAGILRGRPPLSELLSGASIALAAIPEALPALAGLGQAAAARRLAARNVLLRRPAAIEALGRVDIVCVDKTGTLTQGRPSVRRVAPCAAEAVVLPEDGSPQSTRILRAAGLASPHPEADGAGWHATDRAVLQAAQDAGLEAEIRRERRDESRFASDQPYHAAVVDDGLYVKGSPEWVVERCTGEWVNEGTRALDAEARARLLAQVRDMAARGFRVLMIARGEASGSVQDPRDLVALGLVGIADPLRETVPEAVRRCQAAGIRMIMLTGDHPVTAEQIAREAGLLNGPDAQDRVMADVVALDDDDLDRRLADAVVIARTTPLDKLRIVESLRRQGHAIAMTGDGVNDAPALRLADVGVALGRSATAVARHTAEVILEDNDFLNLVEALIEGRSFWKNLRRGLALLLGGNLGELGYMAVGSAFGLGAPLTVRQILAINLITDALPTFALTAQAPEHRVLAGLERGGPAAFGAPLREAMARRALATAGPALGAYLLARTDGSIDQARSVGFATLVFTQLALTVASGRGPGGDLAGPVAGAVAASGGTMLGLLTIPPLHSLFTLGPPTPLGWALIGASTVLAPQIARIPLRRIGL